ncbi:DUF924 family protein [Calothrix sp. PCC 6303]|uniref:DUF924 family protein n=1 Tax=Calothrix sp. PCC 6303 TaxID=1170562 RepID=UPI0002A056EA|nr:DUF924 family protein [Calothrix sp. PCC 6303]AFY99191.1 protein of unknown function DUF924 [Calothrix sp. PCC 6303]
MSQPNNILDFWFGSPTQPEYGKPQRFWFNKQPEFDNELRTRFQQDYEQAAAGNLEDWKNNSEACLALILLLDQFPRNMFRNTPQAFATDPKAVVTAETAISKGYDQQLLTVQRWFIYLPFEHSENIQHQEKAVKLFQQLSNDTESQSTIDYAIRHLEIIQRFGRFPHRNEILGRISTSEEKEFLKQPGTSL